eukprot:COSAG02_NODE_742_length_17794_cov_22.222718_13_plen_54_part_00
MYLLCNELSYFEPQKNPDRATSMGDIQLFNGSGGILFLYGVVAIFVFVFVFFH